MLLCVVVVVVCCCGYCGGCGADGVVSCVSLHAHERMQPDSGGPKKLRHRPRSQTTGNESAILARINATAHQQKVRPSMAAVPPWSTARTGFEGITMPATVHNRVWAPSVQHDDIRAGGRRETQRAPRRIHPKSYHGLGSRDGRMCMTLTLDTDHRSDTSSECTKECEEGTVSRVEWP